MPAPLLITRRAVIATAIASPWVRRAQAAEFEYKFASDNPPGHPLNTRMQEAADQIKKETDGRVQITIFPNSQLGSDPDMFNQLRAGAIQFFTISGPNSLSALVPRAAISGVGFAFKDYDQVYAAMDGKLGAYVRAQIDKVGILALEKIWDNGFRQITSSAKPIKTPADLAGMKIRVPPGRLWVSLFKALGAAPTAISFNEVYSALQTKVVDGQENALATIETGKVFEVQKYCSVTNHMWDGFWFLCHRASWNRLPPATQEIVARIINAHALLERQDVATLNATLQQKLEQQGLAFNTPDTQPFRALLRQSKFYDEQKQVFGEEQWSLLETVTGSLA